MRYPFQGTTKDGNGRIIQSATVTIYLAGTATLASIYAAATGGAAVNSVTADSTGNFIFWVDDINYHYTQRFDIIISSPNHIAKTYSNIEIPGRSPFIDAERYSTFTAAVAAAANKTLRFSSSITLDANITVPATVSLKPIYPGILVANGKTLIINGPLVGNPMHQWLSGFAAGDLIYGSLVRDAKFEWVGAVRNGTTNDAVAIETTIRACYTNKVTIIGLPGTYRSNSEQALYSNSKIIGAGKQTTIFDFSQAGSPQNGFIADGGTASTFTQANDIALGATSYVHGSALSVSAGDFIGFKSNVDIGDEIAGGETGLSTLGELFRIKSISGNTVYFDEYTAFNYLALGSSSAIHITPKSNIQLSDFSVLTTSDGSTENDGIRIKYCDNVQIKNVYSKGAEFSQIRVTHSMDVIIDNPHCVGDGTLSGQDYGVAIIGGSKHIYINNIIGENESHTVSGGGSEGLIPMYVTVNGLTTRRSLYNSFDTHVGTYSWIYNNCQVDNGFNIAGIGHIVSNVQSSGGSMEMYSGAKNCTFKSIRSKYCTSWGSNTYPIRECHFEDIDLDLYNLAGNRFRVVGNDNSFKNYRLKNKSFSNTANNATNDATLASSTEQYVGLQLLARNTFENVYLYGFAIGMYIQGEDVRGKNIIFEACGWDTSLSVYDSVVLLNRNATNASIENIGVIYTSTSCINTAASVIIRMIDVDTGLGTSIIIKNVYHTINHTQNYSGALTVGAEFDDFHLENIKLPEGITFTSGCTGIRIERGVGAPSIYAPPGSLYYNLSGGTGTTLYIKESGLVGSGWAAK